MAVIRPTRANVIRRVLFRPAVALVVGVIAVASNLEWLRDHLLPESLRTRLQWDAALPQLSWQTWAALTSIALVALTLEWAFRELRSLYERISELETDRPKLVLGYDKEYPVGYDPYHPSFEYFSPFYIRNDGAKTAYNVEIEIASRLHGLRFAPLANYPPDRERKRMHLKSGNQTISFALANEFLQDKKFVDRVVSDVLATKLESRELVVHVWLKYDSDDGRQFSERFDVYTPIQPIGDDQVRQGEIAISLVHPLSGAPDASSARA
jgi:hypothetical protein